MGNQSTKHHLHTTGGGPKPKKFVHWKSAERPFPPGRPILIPLSDQQPDVIALKWNRPPSDGGSPIIGYIIEHRRTGSPHWVRATPGLVPKNEISISGLEPGWRYQFRVIAENVIGKSDPSELSDPLTVTLQRNAISVPRFIDELLDTTAVENDRIEMRVTFIGHPLPEINWFKDGFEIFSSRRTKILNDNDSSTLVIHQAAFTDEGEIKCTATNRAGHVVTKARLIIEAPPKIRLPRQYEDGLIFEAEEVVRLKVGVAGQPIPTVMWCHEGEKINAGERFEIETTDKNTSLKITNIKRADRGEYSVKATNKLGDDVAAFLVTVTSRPTPPGKVKLQMSFGRSATLNWEAPSDDGGCKIGNYIIEYFRIGWNVWLKAATTRKQTVTLHDLIEGSEYRFRVKAENPYGLSDPSAESDVLFIPDPSRGITKPQQISELSPNEKPVPPKRRNLSPLRNILGKKRDASPNRQPSPARNPNLLPDVFDSEDVKRDMSYGMSNDMLLTKDSKQNSTKKTNQLDIKAQPSRSPSPGRKSEGNSSPAQNNPSTLKPEGINQKVQNFFRLSPLSARKGKVTEETQTSPRNSPSRTTKPQVNTVQQVPTSPTSPSSPTNVQRDPPQIRFETAPSPIAQRNNDPQPVPRSNGNSAKGKLGYSSPATRRFSEPEHQRIDVFDNTRSSPSSATQISYPKSANFDQRHSLELASFEEEENVNVSLMPRLSLPNPRIEISKPISDFSMPTTPKDRNDVHTSSEFMLVLYPNKKSQEQSKQDSFELDLEESLAHPQLSLSSPDLGSDLQHLQFLQIRRSASSTELLYERAMARFYEAVELEEAEKAKRRRTSQDQISTQNNLTVRKRLGSMTEAERLSFERRSTLRGKLSGDVTQPLSLPGNIPTKWDSKECLNLSGQSTLNKRLGQNNNSSLETQDSEDLLFDENDFQNSSGSEYGEDYTESTASSDSIEKFKIELLARTQPPNPELETYHPGRMAVGEPLSPYRSPEPDQSSVVLMKPLPLPNPDFVPKPILKRPSIDNNIKESQENIPETPEPPSPQVEETKETKPKLRGFKSFFKREKASSDSNVAKNDKLSPKELSPKDSSSKESSPRQPSPQKLSPSHSFSERSPSPKYSTPKELSPTGSIPSPKQLSPKQLSPRELSPKEMSPKEMSPKEMSPKKASKGWLSPKSPKSLSPKELSPTGERTTQDKINAFVHKQDEINQRINKQREDLLRRKLESTKSAEEETKVVVDHYSHIVREMGNFRKDKTPIYLRGNDFGKAGDDEERRPSIDLTETERPSDAALKHRMSIAERIQTAHVQEKSKHAMEQAKAITGESQDDNKPPDEPQPVPIEEKPVNRGRSTEVPKKFKKRGASGSRSRDTSALKIGEKPTTTAEVAGTPKRTASRSRTRNMSKSPGALNRRPLKRDPTPEIRLPLYVPPPAIESRPQTPEEMSEEAQEKIRSTVSYVTDVGLFVVACWVYIFKDARLVIPILALMVYRQISEMIRDKVPNWVPRKKS